MRIPPNSIWLWPLLAVAAAVVLWWRSPAVHSVAPPPGHSSPASSLDDEGTELVADIVALSDKKMDAAGIEIGAARSIDTQPTRTLPGRFDYDQDRHVAVKAACHGVVTALPVQPGELVRAGQVVAVISCPEVGSVRAELRRCSAARQLAEAERDWHADISQGVERLAEVMDDGRTPEDLEAYLGGHSLGAYRESLVNAYSRSILAARLAANTRPAAASGAIADRTQQERETERQTAAASLRSALEQSLFQARQDCRASTAAAADAERQFDVCREKLAALLGPATQDNIDLTLEDEALSEIRLAAPIDGTVEERLLAVNERVEAGEALLVVADATRLWAVAELRPGDWEAISAAPGATVRLTTPALPGECFAARILRIGRRVDPTTGAAPLVAQLTNGDARLRPGLFLRMTVPAGAPRKALVVPDTAVTVHEGRRFVFVPDGARRFRRVDVQVGAAQNGNTEVVAGLKEEEPVVVAGTFTLKSELLLRGED